AERPAGAPRRQPGVSSQGWQHPRQRHGRRITGYRHDPRSVPGRVAMNPSAVFDIYLLEAVINGVLLGGVLALLSLGLNLIFGVIDVVWICYAELIMLGMYGMYFLFTVYHAPIWLAAILCVVSVAILVVLL